MIFGCCIKKGEDIPLLREAGFDYFEFSAAALAAMSEADFEALCRQTETLPCLGLNSYCAGEPAMAGPRYDPARVEAYAAALLPRAAALGARTLGIGSPPARRLPADYPRDAALAEFGDFLCRTADLADEYGLGLALEPLHERCCDLVNTLPQALALLEGLPRQDLGLVADLYHMAVMGEKPEELTALGPRLRHVHVSSCGPALERGFPAQEELPFCRRAARALKDLGYDGALSIEPAAYDAAAAAESLAMLRQAFS